MPLQSGALIEAERLFASGARRQAYPIATLLSGNLDRALNHLATIAALAMLSMRYDVFDDREGTSAAREIGTHDQHARADEGSIGFANEERDTVTAKHTGQGIGGGRIRGQGGSVGLS